jgi:hypothetical protein
MASRTGVLGSFVAALVCAAMLPAASQAAETVPGRVVVGFDDGARAIQVRSVSHPRAAIADLRDRPGVAFAEPVYRTRGTGAPSNSGFSSQWALENTGQAGGVGAADIDALRAWNLAGAGSPSVLIGSVDSGVNFANPGLAGVGFWTDPAEQSGTPGHDDDNDGCVDDLHGCDFVNGDGDPADDEGHGTATASIMVGPWSGPPFAGIAPGSSLITAKALDASNAGNTAQEAAALDYVADAGARVVNVSIAGPKSLAVQQAIESHPDTLFVAAAGNYSQDSDANPTFPCAEPAANVVCVAASDRTDALASFSNHGAHNVDLAAPGVDIAALSLDGPAASWSGTSFAAPVVSGAAALAFAYRPAATAAQVKAALMSSVEQRPAFAGTTASGGRLDAYRALVTLAGGTPDPRPVPAASATHRGAPKVRRARFVAARKGRRLRDGRVAVLVRCAGHGRCAGKLRLVSRHSRPVRVKLKAGKRRKLVLPARLARTKRRGTLRIAEAGKVRRVKIAVARASRHA